MNFVDQRFGPYLIQSPIGSGGMGEVYRAKDSRLGRDVALKILPSHFVSHPERLQRFEREAHSGSALNHPAIITIYGYIADIPEMKYCSAFGRTR